MTHSPLPLLALILALATPACVSPVDEAARGCPCTSGSVCCNGSCVADVPGACRAPNVQGPPDASVPPAADTTPPAAPVLEGSVPASPTNQRTVTVTGSSEPGTRVQLFVQAGCYGVAVAEGSADGAGVFRIPVALSANATTAFHAQARDAAGNFSLCATPGLSVQHDDVAPPAPEWAGVAPASPSAASTQPVLSGRAEPGARVVLYADAPCTSPLGFEAVAAGSGSFEVRASVARNSTTAFRARAVDAAGNASPCTLAEQPYTHDDAPPPAPRLEEGPHSPTSSVSTSWLVSTEPGARLGLHFRSDCADALRPDVTVEASGSVWAGATLPLNTPTSVFARAADALGNTTACTLLSTVTHDDLPPVAPTLVTSSPASPNNSSANVSLTVASEPGAWLEVTRGTSYCGYSPGVWQKVRLEPGQAQLELSTEVPEGTTRFWAQARDEAGNVSPCAELLSYTYDVTLPAAPTLLGLSEPSPMTGSPSVLLVGKAELGAQVGSYADAACAGPALGTTTVRHTEGPTNLTTFTFAVPVGAVPPDAATTYYARAVDPAGNASPCSAAGVALEHRSAGERWHEPEPAPAPSGVLQSAMDASGNLVFLTKNFTTGSLEILRRHADAVGAPWQRTVLATVPANAYTATALDMNERGDAIVAWNQEYGTAKVTRYDADTGTWEAPQSPGPAGSTYVSPRLATDGSAVACWSAYEGTPSGYQYPRDCRTAVRGGAWGATTRVHPGNEEGDVQATGDGRAVALSVRTHEPADNLRDLFARHYAPATGWGAAALLVSDVSSLSWTRDDEGTVWLAYVRRNGTAAEAWASSLPVGTTAWTEPELLVSFTDSSFSQFIGLSAGAAGQVLATWSARPPASSGALELRQHSAAEGWEPVILSPALGSYARATLGRPGEVLVTWSETWGPWVPSNGWATEVGVARLVRYTLTGGWGRAETLSYSEALPYSSSWGELLSDHSSRVVAPLERWSQAQARYVLRVLR